MSTISLTRLTKEETESARDNKCALLLQLPIMNMETKATHVHILPIQPPQDQPDHRYVELYKKKFRLPILVLFESVEKRKEQAKNLLGPFQVMGRPFKYKAIFKALEAYSDNEWRWVFLEAHRFWVIKVPSDISNWDPVKHCIEGYYQMVTTVHVSQLHHVPALGPVLPEDQVDYDSDDYYCNSDDEYSEDGHLNLPVAAGIRMVRTSLEDPSTKLLEKMSGGNGLFDSPLAVYHHHACTTCKRRTPIRAPYPTLEDWVYHCKQCPASARHNSNDACMKCIMAMRTDNMDFDRESHPESAFKQAVKHWPAPHTENITISGFVKHMLKHIGPELFCAASMVTLIAFYKEYCSALAGKDLVSPGLPKEDIQICVRGMSRVEPRQDTWLYKQFIEEMRFAVNRRGAAARAQSLSN